MNNLSAVILAAGQGKRFRSSVPKVVHNLLGVPIVEWVVETVNGLKIDNTILVASPNNKKIMEELLEQYSLVFVLQEIPNGTGGAVKPAVEHVRHDHVLVLAGDVPLISEKTLNALFSKHIKKEADITVLVMEPDSPYGYGRIITDKNDNITKIVEEKDANEEEKKVKIVNSGIYIFKKEILEKFLPMLSAQNAQNEYYITDIIGLTVENNGRVVYYKTDIPFEVQGINDRYQLSLVEEKAQKEIIEKWQKNGVTIHRPQSVYIEKRVKIGRDVEIYPGVSLLGNTIIENNVTIFSGVIKDKIVKEGLEIKE